MIKTLVEKCDILSQLCTYDGPSGFGIFNFWKGFICFVLLINEVYSAVAFGDVGSFDRIYSNFLWTLSTTYLDDSKGCWYF